MPQGALQANVAIQPNAGGTANVSSPLQLDKTGNLLTGQGSATRLNITAGAVLVKATPGRICKVVVNTAGSAPGAVNDCATTGAAAAANLVAAIPNTVGVYSIDMPCAVGIVVTAGTAQVLSVSYD